MSKLKNDNDKYFYSRVNKQYCSNQKMLEDKIEEIRYHEEKETREKLRNANPNSLYNGYYIGKKKCKNEGGPRFVIHNLVVGRGGSETGLETLEKEGPFLDPKTPSCHKCNYKIKIPNINTKYKEDFEKYENKCNCCTCKNKELSDARVSKKTWGSVSSGQKVFDY